MVQPSKVLSLLPRPSGNEDLVLSHFGAMEAEKHSEPGIDPFPLLIFAHVVVFTFLPIHFWPVADVSRQMSLPLNGFCPSDQPQPLSYSPEATDSPVEEWPDWSGPDGDENRDRPSVQIHIQTSERAQPADSRLARLSDTNVEEEPWDDFEDTEPTSDLSPTAPLTDQVLLTPPTGGATTPVTQALGTLRSTESKPLKLTSSSPEPIDSKSATSWREEGEKTAGMSSKLTNSKPKTATPQWNGGTEGLGEEFTIKVKKRVEQDPELDLFADMVPDIKLSSPVLLPANESSAGDECAPGASSEVATRLQADSAVDTATLTAKFAAADLPEVSAAGVSLVTAVTAICFSKMSTFKCLTELNCCFFFCSRRKQTAGGMMMTWTGRMRTLGDGIRYVDFI